jgi:hypothetical protein
MIGERMKTVGFGKSILQDFGRPSAVLSKERMIGAKLDQIP